MRKSLHRLWLGIALIALSSAVLLLSDWGQRRTTGQQLPRLAMMQYASQPLLDEGRQGIVEALADGGFVDGKTMILERFNAENDLGTANAIARQLTAGQYDMIVTTTTRCLQVVGNANKDGKAIHVFGIVADPYVAGVGLDRANPLRHPRHVVGIGSFFPVEKAFRLAKKLYPPLRTVGVAWNPAEANSEAFTLKAREVCRELGIQLVETAVENSSGVLEAANSLVSRGVQALWIGGDVTVVVALDSVQAAARQGRIPVFSIIPPTAVRGSLFDLGANFYMIGRQTGELAAQILNGADPAKIPVREFVPEKLVVNRLALRGLKDPWTLPEDVIQGADGVIDENGLRDKSPRPRSSVGGR